MVDQVLQPLTSFDSTTRRLLVTAIAPATASTRAQPSPTVKHAPPSHAGATETPLRSCEQVLEAVAGIFSLLAAAVEAKLTSGKAFFKQLGGKEQARKVIAKQLEDLLRTWLLDVLYVKPPDSKAEGLLPDLLECAQAQLRELVIVTSSSLHCHFVVT